MIALVISIIVMLILAGVSINAVVGDNGVLTKAKEASIASKKASILEAIDLELASYNIDTILNNPEATTEMLKGLKDKGLIDTVLSSSGQTTDTSFALGIPQFDNANNYTGYTDYGVVKDDYSILLSVDLNGIYKAKYGEVNVSAGGSVAAGTTVVTSNAFNSGSGAETPENKGKFTIDNDASVMFVDEINGELSILVKSGTHAKVNIFKDMTLTNAGVKRSAIDIEAGGTLDLYVAEGATVAVNSGLAVDADENSPGVGAYAGIHVPEGATLNLKGVGVLKAIGGHASVGGSTITRESAAGGGGAGAGIGGNGGDGGKGANGVGNPGLNGEDCGNIFIYNDVTLYAYGGAGGSGGASNESIKGAGGAGGYPAAGIGGGGAGGAGSTCCAGAGGYTGGGGDSQEVPSKNGLCGNPEPVGLYGSSGGTKGTWGGGGYFQGADGIATNNTINRKKVAYGGQYNQGSSGNLGDRSGSGGTAGKGGTIKVSSSANIFAFNGNLYTDGTDYKEGINQCPIYLQQGIIPAKYKYENFTTYGTFNMILEKEQENLTANQFGQYTNNLYLTSGTQFNANRFVNINTKLGIDSNSLLTNVDMSKQGVGSGAGYIEVSNGTYEVDTSLN